MKKVCLKIIRLFDCCSPKKKASGEDKRRESRVSSLEVSKVIIIEDVEIKFKRFSIEMER